MARQRGNSWQAEHRLANGTRVRPGGFKSEAAALVWEAQARAAQEEGKPLPPPPHAPLKLQASTLAVPVAKTLEQLREAVLAADAPEGWKGTSDYRNAEARSQMAVDFFGKDTLIHDLDVFDVQRYTKALREGGNAVATVNRKTAALSKMLTYAKRYKLLATEKPHIGRFKENKQGRIRWLTADEEARLLGVFAAMEQHDFRQLLIFLVDTGARVSEALNLKWRDVVKEGPITSVTFLFTKNGDTRTIPCTDRAAKALAHFKGRSKAKPFDGIEYWQLRAVYDRARKRLGEDFDDVVIHTLRHTCASRLVQRGIDLRRVKDFMGHTDFETTLRYAKLAPGDLVAAAEALQRPVVAPVVTLVATDAHA